MTKKRGILPRIFVGKGKTKGKTIGRIFGFFQNMNLSKVIEEETSGKKPSWGTANPEIARKKSKKTKIIRPTIDPVKTNKGTKITRGQGIIGPAKSMNPIKLKDHSVGASEEQMRQVIANHGQDPSHLGPAMVTVVYNSLMRGKKKET